MATLKQRIKKKNSSGTYDILHLETNSNLVLMDNGNTLQYEMYNHTHTKSQITNFPTSMTPTSHTHTKSQITDFPTSMAPTAHNHAAGDINSGTLSVSRGGTGRSTLTSGYFLRGNGTSAITMSSVADVKSALGISGGFNTVYTYTTTITAYYRTDGSWKNHEILVFNNLSSYYNDSSYWLAVDLTQYTNLDQRSPLNIIIMVNLYNNKTAIANRQSFSITGNYSLQYTTFYRDTSYNTYGSYWAINYYRGVSDGYYSYYGTPYIKAYIVKVS